MKLKVRDKEKEKKKIDNEQMKIEKIRILEEREMEKE